MTRHLQHCKLDCQGKCLYFKYEMMPLDKARPKQTYGIGGENSEVSKLKQPITTKHEEKEKYFLLTFTILPSLLELLPLVLCQRQKQQQAFE